MENQKSTEANALTKAEATLTLVSAWLANFQTLVRLEFNRTLAATKQIIALQLILLPLGIAFVLSLCGGAGLTAYYFSQSIYIAFAAFVLAQAIVLLGILLYQKRLRALLGFSETRRQVKEALSDVSESFK